jgi:hypothetical protein
MRLPFRIRFKESSVCCRKLVARMKGLYYNENKLVAWFPGSSMVERSAVNRRVEGCKPDGSERILKRCFEKLVNR